MANKVLVQAMDGTPKQICFADHATDFSPTAANDLRVTTDGSQELDVQWNFESVANATAWQSAKFDFGADRAPQYNMRAAMEFAATPVAGERVDFYMAYSQSGTAATANPANLTGSSAAYAGYSSNLAASLPQLEYVGFMKTTAQATGTIQVGQVTIVTPSGFIEPKGRYGILVGVNESDAAMHSDAAEIHVVLDPIIPEIQ